MFSVHSHLVRLGICVFVAVVILCGCDDDESISGTVDPEAPNRPQLVAPQLNAQNQPSDLILKWTGSDPDGDVLVYDLYFGSRELNLPMIVTGLTDSSYIIHDLDSATTYYWRIAARDPDGHQNGSGLWHFSTWEGYRYPLAEGQIWRYDGERIHINCEWDYPEVSVPSPQYFQSEVTTSVDGREQNVPPEFRLVENIHDMASDDTREAVSYYLNAGDGLYSYDATMSGSLVLPVPHESAYVFEFGGRQFGSEANLFEALIGGHSDAREPGSPPADIEVAKVLAYPLHENSEWIVRESQEVPFVLVKRVTGKEDVSVPAGNFDCFEIEWLFDYDLDGEYDTNSRVTDYICEIGLVKRSVTVKAVTVMDYDHAKLGVCDLVETWVLTEYQRE
jgi:hypothetical protein